LIERDILAISDKPLSITKQIYFKYLYMHSHAKHGNEATGKIIEIGDLRRAGVRRRLNPSICLTLDGIFAR
jgi:hypothetical protein